MGQGLIALDMVMVIMVHWYSTEFTDYLQLPNLYHKLHYKTDGQHKQMKRIMPKTALPLSFLFALGQYFQYMNNQT